MKASDYIAEFLYQQGVTHVFELVGGMIVHILDSIHQAGKINIVSVHHEQTAAFAADAFGRVTGVPGVAMATGGPGATNLLTGIGSCFFDSSPAVFITGQANRYELKGERNIRQQAFQETDIVSIARPITKGAWQVQKAEDLPEMLRQAFALALEGRPGPVLLDIPMDIQRTNIDVDTDNLRVTPQAETSGDLTARLDDLYAALEQAERPLMLVGGGVSAARARESIRALAKQIGIPVINSLMAMDVMAYDDPLRVGMIGAYGNRWANLAIGRADLMLVIGSRLDIRQTGAKTEEFKGDRVFFQVDVEPLEMNNRVTGVHTIEAHITDFVAQAAAHYSDRGFKNHSTWIEELQDLRAEWPDTRELSGVPGINPNAFLHQLSQTSGAAGTFISDVGQHQMWAGQSIEVRGDQRFFTSGGMGSMGFSLPAAIGATYATGKPVVVVAGDGGFQCNIQELQTVRRGNLPIKMVVINNHAHGMVRQFQESYFDSRFQSTVWGYDTPNFARVAEAYGIPGHSVSEPEQIEAALRWLWQDPNSPALLEVSVDTSANAYPKIAFGRPIYEMEPFFKPVEVEGT
ncbi:MAG: thiamine pyrophosphate-binding protein [Anaerolineae bacterium]